MQPRKTLKTTFANPSKPQLVSSTDSFTLDTSLHLEVWERWLVLPLSSSALPLFSLKPQADWTRLSLPSFLPHFFTYLTSLFPPRPPHSLHSRSHRWRSTRKQTSGDALESTATLNLSSPSVSRTSLTRKQSSCTALDARTSTRLNRIDMDPSTELTSELVRPTFLAALVFVLQSARRRDRN